MVSFEPVLTPKPPPMEATAPCSEQVSGGGDEVVDIQMSPFVAPLPPLPSLTAALETSPAHLASPLASSTLTPMVDVKSPKPIPTGPSMPEEVPPEKEEGD